MLRILRAFAWMRWRTFLNSFENTRSRDVMQRLSIAVEGLAPMLVVVLMIPSALVLAVGAGYLGYLLATGEEVAQVHGIDPKTTAQRSDDLLELMDLKSARDTMAIDFSHGMRKKLSLAAALLPAPRLLFLDEPFEGIDAVASRQIKDLLLSFVSRGGTIFLTSHILEIVEKLSTHIGVIAKGRLVAQGPIEELRAGVAGRRSLEELFIDLVGGDARAHSSLDWI